jgi:hypothetical protein
MTEKKPKPKFYRLTEYEQPKGMTVAAVASCFSCGLIASGMGGGYIVCQNCLDKLNPYLSNTEREDKI